LTIPAEILRIHQVMKRRTLVRKLSGCYYTPNHLTNYALRVAGLLDDPQLIGKRFLDPASGRGNFLLSIADILITSLRRKGSSPSEIVRIICQSLYGFDINPEDVKIAKKKLYLKLANLISEAQRSEKTFKVPRFHIYATDSLDSLSSDNSVETIDSIKARSGEFINGFDYIIGNPPYISIRYLPRDKAATYRKAFYLAYGNFNTYVLFFELGLRLLSKQGVLAFITPDKFLCSIYGERLQKLMSGQFVLSQLSSLDKTSFPYDISANLVISVIRQHTDGETTQLQVKRLPFGEASDNGEGEFQSRVQALSTCFWTAKPQRDTLLVKRLLATGKKLGNLCKISSCIPTGFDKIFVLTKEQLRDFTIEKTLIHPVIRGRDIQRWKIIPKSPLFIVYPYEVEGSELKLVNLERYPGLQSYLMQYKSKLAKRKRLAEEINKSPSSWYRYIDPRHPKLFEGRKIVAPKINRFNRFAMDKNGIFCLNSVFLIASMPPELENFLLGLLNSSVTEFLLTMLSTKVNGLYYRNSFRNLSNLPIPLENEEFIKSIGEVVKEIVNNLEGNEGLSELEEENDLAAYRLFNLNSKEVEIIESFKKWRKQTT
jgi:hypothetical protein